MIDPALIPIHALLRTFRRETSHLRPSHYYQCTPATGLSTDSTLGWNVVRVMPFVVPNRVTITRLGAEVTVAGAAGSLFRLGIYADNGNTFPGALVLDAGTIPGDSATVQELTVSKALKPGLYWVGGAVQGGSSGTQPTLRTLTGVTAGRGVINNGFQVPPAAAPIAPGFAYTGVSDALPAAWTGTISPSAVGPRAFVKIAD